jgi:predicted secreted protein
MRFSFLLCLCLGACLAVGAAEPKTIKVTQGQEFKVTLQYNASTGYQWQFAKQPDEKLLKLVRTDYKTSETKRVGAPGDQVWTFKALAPGKAKIELNYVRPWEKGAAPAQNTNLVVVIKAAKAKAADAKGS